MNRDPLEQYKHVERLELREETPTPKFIKVTCPSCDSEVPASDINIHDKIGKCTSCNVVFPMQTEFFALKVASKPKEEVRRPEGIEIFQHQSSMEIIIDQPLHPLEIIIPTFLYLFAFMFTAIFFTKGMANGLFFGTWVLTIASTLSLINRKKHKAYLEIDEDYLGIYWKPRKFNKNKRFPIQDVDQVYTKSFSGRGSVYLILNGPEGEKHVKLIENLESKSKARYIEQEVERHLGIADRSIPEETN